MYGLIHTIVINECNLGGENGAGIFNGGEVEVFFKQLIPAIDMKLAEIPNAIQIWEDHDPGNYPGAEFKIGVSANAFIETSNISVHACDPQRSIRICIFTCKQHLEQEAVDFCEKFWKGKCVQSHILEVL